MALSERLQRLYGAEKGARLNEKIEQLMESHRNKPPPNRNHSLWDETDIVLITYGDQFQEEGVVRLQTFQKMYGEWFQHLFSIVHFLPFFPYTSDDGFSVVDYKQLNPQMGEWEDVQHFSSHCKVMLDFVCNHVSQENHWFKGFLNQEEAYDQFFLTLPPDTDVSSVTRPRATPLLTPFRFKDGKIRHVWTTFSADQVDLNYSNPNVLEAAIDVLLFYIRMGAEYIRLDAIGFLWKEPGTSSIHLWQTHEIVKVFRDVVESVGSSAKLITETNVPHKDNIAYFGNGHDEAHMVYQFPLPPLVLLSVKEQQAEDLSAWAKTLDVPSNETTYFNFLASHDGIGLNPLRGLVEEERILNLVQTIQANGGLVSYKQNPDGSKSPYEMNVSYIDALAEASDTDIVRIQKMALAHSILLALPGVPALYVQSILGGRNHLEGVRETGQNRSINRQKYGYDEIQQTLEEPDSFRRRVYDRLSQLITVRKHISAFHPDAEMTVLDTAPEVFALKRKSGTEEVVAVHNVSGRQAEIPLKELNMEAAESLLNKQKHITKNIVLEAYSFDWLKPI